MATKRQKIGAYLSKLWTSTTGILVEGDIEVEAGIKKLITADATTAYTFVKADVGQIKTLSNAASIVATVPLEATTPIAIGSSIQIVNLAAGVVTITGEGAVVILGVATMAIDKTSTITKIAVNTWIVAVS